LSELVIADERLYSMGGEVSSPDDALALFQSTGAGDGAGFTPMDDSGGVSLDLGNTASLDVGIHHFENGDIPTEEQLLRLGGPRWPIGLTNRPPPPPIDVRMLKTPDGIACYADFYWLPLTSVTVQLWRHGVLVGQGQSDGNALATDPVIIDGWPERLSMHSVSEGLCLTSSQPFTILNCCTGDELRIIPGLPPGEPVVDSFSQLQCFSSQGLESVLYDAHTVSAVQPPTLSLDAGSGQVILAWPDDRCHLQVAESMGGPWYDMAQTSPATIPAGEAQRFFRLVSR
jgi:hypothetical protein